MTGRVFVAGALAALVASLAPAAAGAGKSSSLTIERSGPDFRGALTAPAGCIADRWVTLRRKRLGGGPSLPVRRGETSADGTWSLRKFPRTSPLDRFDRPDGPVGPGWVPGYAAEPLRVVDGALGGPGEWSAAAFASGQGGPHEVFARLRREPIRDDDYMHLALLDNPVFTAGSGYGLQFDDDYWDLFRVDLGRWTRLLAWHPYVHDPGFFRDGDRVGIGFDGADVVAYRSRNGVLTALGRVHETTYRPEVMWRHVEFSPQEYVRYDDFGGGPPASERLRRGLYRARAAATPGCEAVRSGRIRVGRP